MIYRFKPKKCLAIIAAYPDFRVAPQLIAWLKNHRVHGIMAHRAGDGQMDCGYNYGVRMAINSGYDQFIFADCDIMPTEQSIPFLNIAGDVVGCQYDNGLDGSWKLPDDFHTGLWRTHREVLEKIGPKPFEWKLNELGTERSECLCRGFAKKAQALGFKVVHAGEAVHIPRTTSLPMIMRLADK